MLGKILFVATIAVAIPATADTSRRIPTTVFQNALARGSLDRLEQGTDQFKARLNRALDHSVLNGLSLENHLNEWANLLEDEIDAARKVFNGAAGSGTRPDVKATEHFADHWDDAMMAATAINRAMIRRGFALEAERQWIGIRADLNRVTRAVGRPPLPDMTVVIFRPAPYSLPSQAEVKQVMEHLRDTSHRFENKLDHPWYVAMLPGQREVAERWADDLKAATRKMLDEYKDKDARDFQFKLEEALMLAVGLNRTLMVSMSSAAPILEWNELRSELNTLAARFGYPVLPGTPRG